MSFQVVYTPVGVPTFHLESARREFEKSIATLKKIYPDVTVPDDMLLSLDSLVSFLGGLDPELIIVQNITFANSAYISEILRQFDCPIVLWTLREPVIDGGRLRLNSLTGAFSAANTLAEFGRKFEYIFGSPEEENVLNTLSAAIKATKVKKAIKELKVLQIGHTPQGFGFGRALDAEMMKTFGCELVSIEARELIEKAKLFTESEAQEYLEKAGNCIRGLDKIDPKNVTDFARLYRAYAEFIRDNGIGALSSRCWPDFFTSFGTPVCAVLAMLNDMGIASACEADTYGALSMFVAQYLTGKSVFFGDPVSIDENENTVTFWHCGTAACSLAREDTGAVAGLHCNRKIGPTLDFGCKAEKKVTVFRIGKIGSIFRLFVCTGEALDKPKQFIGTSIVVKTDSSAKETVCSAVKEGWEPHFAVAMGDIKEEIKMLGNFLGIEVCEF